MKIKCVICGVEIPNPTIKRVTCGSMECKKKYQKDYKNEYNKAYINSLLELRNRHKKEFEHILNEKRGGR